MLPSRSANANWLKLGLPSSRTHWSEVCLCSEQQSCCCSWNISKDVRLNLSSNVSPSVQLSPFVCVREWIAASAGPVAMVNVVELWRQQCSLRFSPGLFLFLLAMTNRKTLWLCSCTIMTAKLLLTRLLIAIPPTTAFLATQFSLWRMQAALRSL